MLRRLSILKTFSVVSSIQTVIVYLYVFFMARFASPSEYANYMAIAYVVDFTVAISLFGFNLLVLREKMDYVRSFISSFLIISLLIILGVYALYCVFIRPMSAVDITLGFLLIILNYFYQMLFSFLIKLHKNKTAFVIVFSNFLFIIASLISLVKFATLTSFNVLLIREIQVGLFVVVASKAVLPALSPISNFGWRKIKYSFTRAFPVGGSTIVGTASQYADKFILSKLDALSIAQYSVARFDIPFIGIFLGNMSLVYMEKMRTALGNKDYETVRGVLQMMLKYGWIFNVLFFTLLFTNSRLIITILYSEQYAESHILFRIILINYLLRMLPYTNVIISMGLEKIIMRRLLIEMVLQVSASLILLHFFGLVGLAASLGGVLLFWSVPYNFYYISKAARSNIRDFMPLKSMSAFFLKCFVPCYLYKIIAENVFHQEMYSVSICSLLIVILINFKEIRYLYSNTK